MRTSRLPLVLGLVLAAALPACGDDEPKGPTRAEWSTAANKICADARTKLAALGPAPLAEPAALPEWAKQGLAIRAEQTAQLKATPKPADQQAAIDATLAKADRLLKEAQATLEATKRAPAFGELTELQAQQITIQEELAAHGPTECGPQ